MKTLYWAHIEHDVIKHHISKDKPHLTPDQITTKFQAPALSVQVAKPLLFSHRRCLTWNSYDHRHDEKYSFCSLICYRILIWTLILLTLWN